jgi:hypothetical protein
MVIWFTPRQCSIPIDSTVNAQKPVSDLLNQPPLDHEAFPRTVSLNPS